MTDRDLHWDGCFNARDLGLLPVAGGGLTRWGAVVRADSLDHLSRAGWAALVAHGTRTIVDLRNPDERLDLPAAPAEEGIATVHVPLDDADDRALWRELWDRQLDGTPLYYGPFLERPSAARPRWRPWRAPGRARWSSTAGSAGTARAS